MLRKIIRESQWQHTYFTPLTLSNVNVTYPQLQFFLVWIYKKLYSSEAGKILLQKDTKYVSLSISDTCNLR